MLQDEIEERWDEAWLVVSFLNPQQVAEVAAALRIVDKEWLRVRYATLDPSDYGSPVNDDDFGYVWSCFSGLPEFYRRVADAGRSLVFTVDL